MIKRAVIAAAVTVALAVCPSCAPAQREGSVTLLGDSITIQSFAYHGYGDQAPGDRNVIANLGWHAGTPELTWRAQVAANDGDGDHVIIALLTNDSADGWDQVDVDRWETLVGMYPAETCLVVVLPASRARGLTSARSAQLDASRAGARGLLAGRPNTVWVDWQSTVDAYGGTILHTDGIHLAAGPDGALAPSDATAAKARRDMVWAGEARC